MRRLHIPTLRQLPVTRVLSRVGILGLVAGAVAFPLLSRAASASATVASPQPVGSSGGANLVFADEFNGPSLDTSKWRTCAWWAATTCSIESNNEQELYTPNNVSVANGMLDLQARQQSSVAWNGKTYNYTSGMISSGGLSGSSAPGFTYKYGYAEARVKVPAGQGLWPAFWTLPSDYSWPPEIDAMEILGNQPNTTYMHYHYLDGSGAEQGPGLGWTGPDFSAGWHTFGVDWQPNAITWYVDGVARWSFTDAAMITAKPQYLVLNLAVGGNWPGPANATTPFPSDYLVDYVRVWDHFGTPGTTTTTAPAATTTTAPAATTTTTAPGPTTTTTLPPPPPASGYAGAVAADGPVSYWRLGDTSGTTAADAMGRNSGTYRNGVALGAPSLLASDTANKAATFNGVNNSVSVPSSAGLSPTGAVTAEAWVQPSAIPAAGSFASVLSKAESYSLQFNGPQLEFTTIQGTTRRRVQAPAGAIVAGQRYHVVGTYDGTTQRLYVNGALVASAAFSGALNANTNPVSFGSWDGAKEFLSGTIDEAAVYAKVLSAAQIANHYQKGGTTTPPPSPAKYATTVAADNPVSYWRLGETSGTTAADSVGPNTGTYSNGVTLGAPSLLASDGANQAATFNGVNNFVSIPSSSALSPTGAVTVEAWVRPSAKPAAGSFQSIVTKTDSYSLQFNGPQLEFTTIQGTTRRRVQAPASSVVAGQTYHIVGTYDGITQRLYVNGSQVAWAAFSGAVNVNAKSLYIASWDGASEFVAATIDEVAVYGSVLTPAQIVNHYQTGQA